MSFIHFFPHNFKHGKGKNNYREINSTSLICLQTNQPHFCLHFLDQVCLERLRRRSLERSMKCMKADPLEFSPRFTQVRPRGRCLGTTPPCGSPRNQVSQSIQKSSQYKTNKIRSIIQLIHQSSQGKTNKIRSIIQSIHQSSQDKSIKLGQSFS